MKAEFDVRMDRKAMYNFLMYHTYSGFSGFFSTAVGIGILIWFFVTLKDGDLSRSAIYGIFGVLFLVYLPGSLFMKAVQQVKLNPVYKKPLNYTMDEDGITTRQGDQMAEVKWENILKVRETRISLLVYTGKAYCFVLPKKAMGSQLSLVKTLIREKVDPGKVKIHDN